MAGASGVGAGEASVSVPNAQVPQCTLRVSPLEGVAFGETNFTAVGSCAGSSEISYSFGAPPRPHPADER
eukprot:719620-Pyramimonas_sp.AAC.2